MTLELGPCPAHARPELIAALDLEFVTGRGRTRSVAERYPHLFAPSALEQIFTLRDRAALVACAIARPFAWRVATRSWRGAMIGMVYTAPAYRGRGHGSRLLRTLGAVLQNEGFDFAVLWSGLDGYYERLGWRRGDCGAYGIVTGDTPALGNVGAAESNIDPAILAQARAVHAAATPHLLRESTAWRALPLPVTECRIATAGGGYALYGVQGPRVYLYEMLGPPQAFSALWRRCIDGAREGHINVEQFGPAYRWLTRHTRVRWRPQQLAYWLLLSDAAQRVAFGRWYVPYFDRI